MDARHWFYLALALIVIAALLALGALLHKTYHHCPSLAVTHDTVTVRIHADTVRVVAVTYIRTHDTLTEYRPALPGETPDIACIDTTGTRRVTVIADGVDFNTDLEERLHVCYDFKTATFSIEREAQPIIMDGLSTLRTVTVEECPPLTWYEQAGRYILYGLAAVGIISITATTIK